MRLQRREFLKSVTAGLFFPSLIPATAIGRGNRPAPSNRIHFGLIGAGYGLGTIGKFLRFPETQVVAVCDVDSLRAKNAASGIRRYRRDSEIKVFADFREIFAPKNLDAVVIATPDHWHAPMCVAAARAGVDIYLEAPFSKTPSEGREIVQNVLLHGRRLQCALTLRSSNEWNSAIEIVNSGVLGTITHVEIGAPPTPAYAARQAADIARKIPRHLNYDAWVGPARWHDYDPRFVHYYWRWVSDFGGGELAETTFHYVDAALRGIGMQHSGPAIISGTGQFATFAPYDIELSYHAQLTFQNGVQMQISTEFPRGVRFIGNRGWLYIQDAPKKTAPILHASAPEILQQAKFAPTQTLSQEIAHCKNFIDTIKQRNTPRAPAEPAHRAATITQLAHIAILLGRRLNWNPDTETLLNDPTAATLLRTYYRTTKLL